MRADAYPAHLPARIEDVQYTPNALVVTRPISFERWQEIGTLLGRLHASLPWLIGDWLLYGEGTFGEMAHQASDATGLHFDTVRGYAWVAERVPAVRRRTSLSWSAHREVAALPPAEADALLERAEREGLGSRDLRQVVRARRALEAPEETETVTLRVRRADVARWRQAAGPRSLSEVVVEALDAWCGDGA